jgi:HlyD family secretion protein
MIQNREILKSSFFSTGSLAALLLLSTGCSTAEKVEDPVVSVQTTPAERATISETVSAEAVVYPVEQAVISPKITAPITEFKVQRGSPVKKGQLLAILENRDLAGQAETSKGNFEQADAGYVTSVDSTIPQEVQKAELDAAAAKAAFDAQQKVYDSRKELLQQGAIPQREMDAAEVALAQARTVNEVAQKQLADLQRLGKAQALKSAHGSRQSAEGQMRTAEAQFSYSEIRSPIDGVVTDRPLYAGDLATANQPILTVMNLSRLIAKSHVPQAEAAKLKLGNSAELKVSGLGEPVKGRITLVSPALDPGSTTIEVWVEAAKPNPAVKPGMTIEVSMTGKTVKDAIVVPAGAVFKNAEGGTDYVVLAGSDQKAHWKTVQIGVRNGEDAQVVSGISAGDPIISSGGYALPDNTKIKIEAAAPSGKDEGDKAGKAEKDGKAGGSAKPDDKDKE